MGSVCVPHVPPSSEMDPPHPRDAGGDRSVSDHPLLVMRKRMLSGETKHTPGYRRSDSELVREENLRIVVASHPIPEDCPSPTSTQELPPLSPPPTPGRDHDIRWDIDFPPFLPLPARDSTEQIQAVLKTPEQDNESPEMSPPTSRARKTQLRPRFDCAWLIEISQAPEGNKVPPIPYAPFCVESKEDDCKVAPLDIKKYQGSLLPTGKLADMNLGQKASAIAAKARPQTFSKRTGINARCA